MMLEKEKSYGNQLSERPILLAYDKSRGSNVVAYIYLREDGTIEKKKVVRDASHPKTYINHAIFAEVYKRIGDKAATEKFLNNEWVGISLARRLCEKTFKTMQDIEADIRKRIGRSKGYTRRRNRAIEEWNAQVEDVSDVVIGLDEVGVTEFGVEVWLLLNTRYTFEQQYELVRNNRHGLIKYIVRDIERGMSQDCVEAKAILPHCKPVQAIVRNNNAAIIRFQYSQDMQKAG